MRSAPRVHGAGEADQRQQHNRQAGEERLLVRGREGGTSPEGRVAPDQALRRGGEETPRLRREALDLRGRPLSLGVIIDHAEVRPRLHERDEDEDEDARGGRYRHPPGHRSDVATDAGHEDDHREHREQVGELETEREPQGHLPRRDQPAAEHEPWASPPVAAQEQEQRQWDAAAREHLQMAVLGEPPRCVRERCPCSNPSGPAGAQLAGKQIRAQERECVCEEEEQVVRHEGRVRPALTRTGPQAHSRPGRR